MGESIIKRERIQKKKGLFGGTFNPIHIGHLRAAEEIREAFKLSEIIFIPSANPPHKEPAELIEASHRFEMVKRATAKNPFFSTNDIELQRRGKSYTIETLKCFKEKDEDILFFILGGDAFVEIETWKDYKNLFFFSNFIVMTRQGVKNEIFNLPPSLSDVFKYDSILKGWKHISGNMLFFKEITFLDISSTKIRELIEKGQSVKYLIPHEVEEYIKFHGLYKKP